MELTSTVVEAHTRYVGYSGHVISGGDRVLIQVADETVLDHTCPANKQLIVTISVRAELTDK